MPILGPRVEESLTIWKSCQEAQTNGNFLIFKGYDQREIPRLPYCSQRPVGRPGKVPKPTREGTLTQKTASERQRHQHGAATKASESERLSMHS